ncbi:unnamed protein product [Thlaspi arvense]|uniref:RRM domain-containing protein n=1 Tax=Thlaspi arvense TaxID=13288 RepID=A0AAU9SRI4_THLAR|nr:unnamed protein product [Thlaspi arvense]
MASSSQRRCVFVGNIPYDVTEEQLREICGEVGPVVSFRLVTDRETGKPKGYGFCEYKDEETALSALRNLKCYQINGRQLRFNFAENDKGTDQSQGGAPGLPATTVTEPQKQTGDSNMHQPVGLQLAITAASVMAGALGGPQAGSQFKQSSLQSDPLTLHLASMSRTQLTEIISSIKLMATLNKEQTRQLLASRPQLLKAVFLAQVMLGIVSPQVLQTPSQVVPRPPVINRPSKMMRVQLQEKAPQTHLTPDVQSTMLQQVMNLTPEQLRMLTPEQQQQVLKLQQALKQDHMMQPL